ncbi:PAS domain S-box protein [Paractinoplanes durhamensis]|uniref:PAS domain S-box protein n=1 Tax=Paractinoplanes durhamensis TaxID=113563 RepID=A0ABQ3ZCM0_9ACTN|nr:PAS domain S-box protein [Actinoplanes durhamensis]GIE07560.1 hypothetical protein Adu01nite_89100 [Actinoplanes durhamensis]
MDAVESARLAALRDYGLPDPTLDEQVHAVVRMASAAIQVPYAAVNVIDEHLQCQLTTVGFEGSDTSRTDSMCALHFRDGDIVWTADASTHSEYALNPWVDGTLGKVRFYASAPLVTPDGHALGSFCVFDTSARDIGAAELALLKDSADVLMALFDRRRQARVFSSLALRAEQQSIQLAEALREAELREAFTDAVLESADVGIVACDAAGHLTLFNRTARNAHGIDADPDLTPAEHAARYSLFRPDGVTPLAAHEVPLARALNDGGVTEAEFVIAPVGCRPIRLVASGRALVNGDGERLGAVVVQRDVTDERDRVAASAQRAAREADRLRTTIAVQRELTTAATDQDRLLSLVAEQMHEVFRNCGDVIVGLLEQNVLTARAVTPGLRHLLGTELGTDGTSLSGEAVRTGTTLRTGDAGTDPRADRTICAAAGIVSMMAAPLFAGDEVIGAVTVVAAVADAFDEHDEQQLTLLAGALSGALRQAEDAARKTKALAALEQSETRFRLGFDRSPLGMVLTGLQGAEQGVFLQANPALAAITGHTIERLVGMNVRELQHPDDVPGTVAALQSLAAGRQEQVTYDKRYRHADGHYIWVRVHAAVVRDDTGTPAYLVTQIEDIDAQRNAAAQLAERAQLLDLTQDAVIVHSLDGGIRYWNPAAEHIYGWQAQVATGHDLHRLLATTWPDETNAAFVEQTLREHGRWTGELEHRRADGKRVVLLSRMALQRDTDGNPIAVLAINTDITARRTVERALTTASGRWQRCSPARSTR